MFGPLYEAAKLLALLSLSWLTPIGRLRRVAQSVRALKTYREHPRGATTPLIAYLLADQATQQQAAAMFHQWQLRSLESAMQIMALRRPFRRWRPEICLRGLSNLTAALQRGAGAVLWNGDFVYTPLIVKVALHQAGLPVVQLARPEHGFSVSPFSVRFLNPIWLQVEDRFLGERVVIENNDATDALKILRSRLADNRIVSITAAATGRRTLDVAFLRGRLRLATGPAHLARTSGTPLLPVFVVGTADGTYQVTIGEALDLGGSTEPAYFTALSTYARLLEPFVREHPDQWNGWIALGRLAETDRGFAESFGFCAPPSAGSNRRQFAGELERRAIP